MFVTKRRINFFDADAAGVLFYGKYYEVCHAAFEEFTASRNKYEEYFASPETVFPLIHSEASYHSPLLPGEEVSVEISLVEKRNSSYSLIYTIKKEDGKKAAVVKTVTVSIDKIKWQKVSLPPFVVEMLNGL